MRGVKSLKSPCRYCKEIKHFVEQTSTPCKLNSCNSCRGISKIIELEEEYQRLRMFGQTETHKIQMEMESERYGITDNFTIPSGDV